MKNTLILIPTYNEVMNIASLVKTIETTAKSLKSYKIDLLVIDDESPDGTQNVVKTLQKEYKNIHLLTGERQGLGNAYLRGLNYSLHHPKYSLIVMMDADLSHDPKELPKLLGAIEEGYDYVIGSRYAKGATIATGWPRLRRWMSILANLAAKKLTGTNQGIEDMTGGFKVIRASALRALDISVIKTSGYVFQVSLLYAFIDAGYRITEVPIAFVDRKAGKSKLRFHDVVEFFYRSYKLNPDAPIQKFVRFGFVGACGTVVNLVTLTILYQFLHIDALIAAALAIEVSIVFNFFLNHFYTFKGYGSYSRIHHRRMEISLKKLLKFNIGAFVGAMISFATFALLFQRMHLDYITSDIVAIITAMSWNYWISVRFVWKETD